MKNSMTNQVAPIETSSILETSEHFKNKKVLRKILSAYQNKKSDQKITEFYM